VAGVGEQRQRVGQEPACDLDSEDQQADREGGAECAVGRAPAVYVHD